LARSPFVIARRELPKRHLISDEQLLRRHAVSAEK
jgi:hypothetical protein